ncbi:uncharacterized protein LOC126906712 isoform X1 [Daktulosphaira vitifoliae]|uniref:uncharacterized protein LOC126906712 isoform X1 n=1 Tax=Daktulosphaira vitifoliae TaxID=58002 RepID=UPI0021AA31F6|nr:uncharacterized protein LOC126906712 isoform X1 [Daktulosphaira vitifoliae]
MNSLIKIMQGALNALNIMHNNRWIESKQDALFSCMFSTVQKNHENIKEYPFITITLESSMSTFIRNQFLIDSGSKHCKYTFYNEDDLWQEWNKEYETMTSKGCKLPFFDYLSQKLHDKIRDIMVNKFIKLGFLYDMSTQNIAVPLQIESTNSELHPIPNYTITDEMYALMQTESIEDAIIKVPSENRTTPVFIDLLNQESKDENLEVLSENLTTPVFIDFLKQGLNPNVSSEEISEPKEIDKQKITMYNFI